MASLRARVVVARVSSSVLALELSAARFARLMTRPMRLRMEVRAKIIVSVGR